ncbi:uncharacterized protein N7477_006620 [Penicillium maclennaniae]|uniref:uncharacterized protein n=1 Tax=Penicillium maclennaniae TaxID=1343394 RepID=UPI00254199F4|nr:uncharacterized protein N7477_006620 [Penicillium maclennaniae]KAJ5668050.1 hypothetical protein N7477_006620 [Penicillium maclennaniae]
MARRASRLSAATTPALVSAHETLDDMSLDVPEQLLTPEASRSETSSNNENASTEEKPATRRRSTRVARVSLVADTPDIAPEKEETSASSSQAYVDSLAKAKRTRSSLRHSLAVMDSSLFKGTADDTMTDNHSMAPDTPVSKSSQETPSEDMATSLQQRNLRKRVEKALDEDEGTPKAKNLLDRANSVLGKRSRNRSEKGKELGRRASLRSRNVVLDKSDAAPPPAEPASKKRRVSESDLSRLKAQEASPSEEPTAPAVKQYKPKRWLPHGLYTGQEPTDAPPKQRRSKTSAKASGIPQQRKLMPMPMFAGARMIQNGRNYQVPFDIFSPLPPGQPKPDEWRKTNKNVFIGDASSEWRANKKLELSTCMCEEETGCDEDCQNRYMFYECDSGNCRLGPECGNRNFSELKQRTKAGGKYNVGVEVIKTVDRGYGVRSNRTFEPNQIIVEYTGEIITQIECERRMRSVYKNNECYYLMYFDQNMIIDATRGSIARFVNHSCEPNCRMEKWTVAGKPRMALFAGENGIMTGQELSYDYNFNPYSSKNVQQCRCGAENCRGILGPRPKDKDQRPKIVEEKKVVNKNKKMTGTKRKLADEDESTNARGGKKRKMITPKSIKASVKKVITKATTARGKAVAKKAATTGRGRTVSKQGIKLPKVKTAARVKAAIRGPRRKAETAKAKPTSSAKNSPLKRPSAETKKQILAAAAKGSRSQAEKSPAKSPAKSPGKPSRKPGPKPGSRKAPMKSPVKARMPFKEKGIVAASSSAKAKTAKGKGLGASVRNAAKTMMRGVKGMKK